MSKEPCHESIVLILLRLCHGLVLELLVPFLLATLEHLKMASLLSK